MGWRTGWEEETMIYTKEVLMKYVGLMKRISVILGLGLLVSLSAVLLLKWGLRRPLSGQEEES